MITNRRRPGTARTLERAELTADRVLEELRRLASPDIRRQLFTADGHLKPIHTLPRAVAACIAAVENGAAGEVVKIQLHDQGRAAALLARSVARLEASGAVNGVEKMAAPRSADPRGRRILNSPTGLCGKMSRTS
jgi:hypothetical protein